MKRYKVHKVDDYGTFFYKLRNGNLPFEYDIENQIRQIRDAINKKNWDITSGIISTIAAGVGTLASKNDWLFFLSILLIFFIVLQLVYLGFDKIKELISKCIEKKVITEYETEQLQDLFFRKTIVQTTYVFSIVKRSNEIKTDVDRKDLLPLYAMQAIYGVRKITTDLCRVFYRVSNDKKSAYVEVLGENNLNVVLNTLNECLCLIKKRTNMDVQAEEDRINTLHDMIKNPEEFDCKNIEYYYDKSFFGKNFY